jgi:hypothetical protein
VFFRVEKLREKGTVLILTTTMATGLFAQDIDLSKPPAKLGGARLR